MNSIKLLPLILIVFLSCFLYLTITNSIEKYYGYRTDDCRETPPYLGLASPAGMLRCSNARLLAQDACCGDCNSAALVCLSSPNTDDCQNAIKKCLETCPVTNVSTEVMNSCGSI